MKVTWIDASWSDRWKTIGDLKKEKPVILESYGMVAINNREKIVLYGEKDISDEMVRYTTSIPKKYVRSIEFFEKKRGDMIE